MRSLLDGNLAPLLRGEVGSHSDPGEGLLNSLPVLLYFKLANPT
jgi:hypothetical protein